MFTKKSLQSNKPGAVIIEGHVQGLANTRSLGEAGIPIIVVDTTNCIARYSKYCSKYLRCPEYNTDRFANFLIDIALKENIKKWLLIPSNDHAVYTIAKHKERLEQYYKSITPGLDIINNIYDKFNLISIAINNNIPVPVTYNIKSLDDNNIESIHYPVITKGRNGLSFYKNIGKKALVAHNQNELYEQLNFITERYTLNSAFIQELIPFDGKNNTISFTAFCIDGDVQTFWMGEKLREHPLRFGTATFARSVYIEECYKHAVPLIKALKYTGVCEIEFLMDPRDKKYKLIEVNARTWLWVGLARRCGIDYPLMIYNYVNGYEFEFPRQYALNLKWRNLFTDTIYGITGILNGKYNLKDYYDSLKGDVMDAVWMRSDPKPMLAMTQMLISLSINR
jgi:D-aspartate ligase